MLKFGLTLLICISALLLPSTAFTQYGDCFNSAQACTSPNFPVTPSGFGTVDELAGNSISNPSQNPNPIPGNAGCLLAGELNSTWILITVSSAGTLEFSIGDGVTTPGCIDWAMWPYDATACADIANNMLPPVACNWNGACGGITGMANNIPPPGSQFDFETPLNVNPGDQFVLCFSNYSGQTTNFPLDFFGTASVTCGLQDETICEGDTAVLVPLGSPGATYAWDPNATLTTNTNGDTAWAVTNVSDYYVVHITDSVGNVVDDTAFITVIPTIVPTVTPVNDNCLTSPSGQLNISITGGANPTTYEITGPVNDQNQNGAFTGLPVGTYTITIYPTNNPACAVTVDTSLILECGIADTTICEGDTVILAVQGYAGYTFSWDPDPNMYTSSDNDSAWVYPSSTTDYVVYLDDGNGNVSTDTATVTVVPTLVPTVNITDNNCANNPNGEIDITTTGGVPPITYIITGPTNDQNTTGMFTGLPDGTYTVTIYPSNHQACAITFDTTIAYIQPDSIYWVGDTSICFGDTTTITLINASGYDILWSTGDTTESIEIFSLTDTIIAVTINTGCDTYVLGTTVIVNPLPIVDAGVDTSIAVEESIQLDASGGVQYVWDPTTGLDCFNCPDPMASPLQTTLYTVTVMDTNGCINSDWMTLTVEYLPLFIPTGFSPNGDGQNDVLYVRGAGITTMLFLIYDRWGNLVFESRDRSIGWNGTIDGKPAASGAYGYQFTCTRGNGEIVELKGNVTLFR